MNKRILVVEDDETLASVLRDNLEYDGFIVECVPDGLEAVERIRTKRPHLILLDLMIPSLDGFEVCRFVSARPDRPPIIILSARTQQEDKIRGLTLGADDYVTKPFSLDELLARIHAVLRRTQPRIPTLSLGDVTIDFEQMAASGKGCPIDLTPREFALLQHLAEHAGKVVTRDELLRVVWGYQEIPLTRTVDNFVARLRRKIEPDPHQPRYIRTMYGDGYSLVISSDL
jgi:DNA-binding response OmpR family regulator